MNRDPGRVRKAWCTISVSLVLGAAAGACSDAASDPPFETAAKGALVAPRPPEQPVADAMPGETILPDAETPDAACATLNPDMAIDPVFVGASAFVSGMGPSSRNPAHTGAGGNPYGTGCIVCHNPGGAGVPFLFAGSVKGLRRAGSEVRFRDLGGRITSVHTDADGNFFFLKKDQANCFEFPVRAGVRNVTGEKTMVDPRTTGNCNGCHILDAP